MRFLKMISLFILFALPAFSQNVFRDLKSLEKRADQNFREMSYMTAIDLYKQVIEKKKYRENPEVRIKIARSYQRLSRMEEAEFWYREAMKMGLVLTARDSAQFAQILISNGKYATARDWMNGRVMQDKDPVSFELYRSLVNSQKFYRDSFSFEISPFAGNSTYADFSPVYYNGGLIFASDRPVSKLIRQINLQKDAGFAELYFTDNQSRDTLKKYEQVKMSFNSPLNKGPVLFYDNGRRMILTANDPKSNTGRLQLFMAEWDEKKAEWRNFIPFAYNGDFYSVSHPALSKDERTLYFVSDMPGGIGGTDIYISTFENGDWTRPQNLRDPVNSAGNEMFPYVSPSGNFYFASDGHGGLGGMDIFSLENGQKGPVVVNAGYPLNSSGNDFGIIMDKMEKTGYFTSDRKGGKGEDDIYSFYVKQIEFRLQVADELNRGGSGKQQVALVDSESTLEVRPLMENSDELQYILKPYHTYNLTIRKEDYKTFEKEISTHGMDTEQSIDLKATLKRKFEYYVSLKIRDEETENLVDGANIQILNLTTKERDSIGISKGEMDFKLDAESDYLLLAFTNYHAGQLSIDKQNKKKVSSVRYFTVNITDPEEHKIRVTVRDEQDKLPADSVDFVIKNMATGEERPIGLINGEFDFPLKNGWYYRIYYSGKKYFYDSLKDTATGNLKFERK